MQNNNLKGKIAVITGCNKGIGKAILSEYAKNGVNCISCVRSVSDDFKAFCQNLSEENNVKVSIVKMDLSDNKLVSESVKEIFKISKKIDILVNNAGINKRQFMHDITENDWDNIMDTNLKSVFFFTKKIWPLIKKKSYSKIINISSVAGQYHGPKTIHYSISKAGINSLTKLLARYGAEEKILVNAVAPGIFKTEQTSEEFKSNQAQKIIRETTLLNKAGEPDDLRATIRGLVDLDQKYLTGQIIALSGGAILHN